MIPEIALAILPAALRVAAASRGAFVRVNLLTDLISMRQHQHLAGLVPAGMADEGVFARGRGRAPEHDIADAIVGLRAGRALPLF
jgi:hypothetical protein